MTYELYVLRLPPGHDWSEAVDELTGQADEPAWPRPELGESDVAAWDRIVHRVQAALGTVTEMRSATKAVLRRERPRLRLEFTAEHARIKIPYWYTGRTAWEALEQGYTVARIVAAEIGGIAVDPRTGRVIPSRGVVELVPCAARHG